MEVAIVAVLIVFLIVRGIVVSKRASRSSGQTRKARTADNSGGYIAAPFSQAEQDHSSHHHSDNSSHDSGGDTGGGSDGGGDGDGGD